MSYQDFIVLLLSILGGVALFIVGMNLMTDGLREAVGERLREILSGATANRFAGTGFGILLGFLVHSSAATVMTVGFVNAGMMALRKAIPLLMGASIGTTLSMQLVSFRLADYAFPAIGIGFLAQILVPRAEVKNIGSAVVGFGLLFLAMDFLGNSISPYREALAPWLERIDGTTWSGMIAGVLAATVLTALIQSSGATIGMLFAMISAGIFTNITQVYPIVLGAHIGTAATALLVSISTRQEARRTAFAHLLFQIFNVVLALLLTPVFVRIVAATSSDLVRQAANLHTLVMVAAVAAMLPFTGIFAQLVYRITPSRSAIREATFLERSYLRRPEKALRAAVSELGRAVSVCQESFRLARRYVGSPDRRTGYQIRMNEKIVDEIKPALKAYMASLTRGYLSRRQALMIQYINHCMADIERIGDHIESLHDIRLRQKRDGSFSLDEETTGSLEELYDGAEDVLGKVGESLSADNSGFADCGEAILATRDRFDAQSMKAKARVSERIAAHRLHPIIGLYFSDYVSALDRVVKHSKMIGREMQQPYFWFKPEKMDQEVDSGGKAAPGEQNIPEPLPKPRRAGRK